MGAAATSGTQGSVWRANSRQWKLVYPRRIGKSAVSKVTRRRILRTLGVVAPGGKAALFIPRVVARRTGSGSSTATGVFLCPHTGQVQGWFADDGSENGDDTYEAVNCLA